MLSEVESAGLGVFRAPFNVERMPSAPAPLPGPVEIESAEQEIARLTWLVLDRSASMADRQRLAALVKAQHESRHRLVS